MIKIARLSVAWLLTMVAVVAIPPGIASAAEHVPALQWGPLQRKMPNFPITGLDGSVTLPCDDGNPGSDLVTYDAAGNITRQLQRSQQVNGYTNCIRQPAVAADGDIYGYNKDTTNLLAYEGNTLKWSHWGGCYGSVSPVVVGANGVIYTINEDGGKRYLIGLTPEVDPTPGYTIPRVIVKAEIEGMCTATGRILQPYNDGIVVFDQMNGPTWFSYAGKKLRKPAGMGGGVMAAPRFNAQGELFFTAEVNSKTVIKKYSPVTDTVLWSFELPNWNMVGLTPTSDGGVAATYIGPPVDTLDPGDLPFVNQSYAYQLVMLNSAGAKLRVKVLRQPDNTSIVNNAAMYADAYGGLAIVYSLVEDITLNGVTTRYRKVAVQRMVYATGNVFYSDEIRGDYVGASPYGYELNGPPMFADDTVYITAKCASPNFTLCNPTQKLYPLEVAGMGMDYPRAEVLASPPGGQPSPVNYAALGDSFASGQGNEPYLPGTNVSGGNQCKRSYQSYARIMGVSPLTPLQLTDFVTCAGARTDHITGNWTGGNSGEGPQVDALSGDTEAVTVSIGGNDIGFVDFVWDCFTNCTQGAATAQWKIDNELPASLSLAYHAILDAAENADVYVVGYPQLLSELDNLCVNSAPFNSTGNRQLAIDLTNNLNSKIQEVVNSIADPRLHFIPLVGEDSPFNGHSICSSNPYFWGLDFNQGNIFHPNGSGAVAQAMVISEYMF